MSFLFKLFKLSVTFFFSITFIGIIIVVVAFYQINPTLPSIEDTQKYSLDAPLRIYSNDQKMISEFGVLKREPLEFNDIPVTMINAILAAEDSRFFEHPGVDILGITRAVIHLLKTGTKGQGGSTITMQVARNFFLSSEKTYIRKIKEIFLSLKLENFLSKEKILELYLNKIYLGHRAYGIATAAKIYYGKTIAELSLDQYAMIAGLPKAPSKYNPVTNRERATIRRNYVLKRMLELGYINENEYQNNITIIDNAELHKAEIELDAPYIAEMARSWLSENELFKDSLYTGGYKVITTIDSRLQPHADTALRQALLSYDKRHGYKGVVSRIKFPENFTFDENEIEDKKIYDYLLNELKNIASPGHLIPSVVLKIVENKEVQKAVLYTSENKQIELLWEQIKWASKYISENRKTQAPKTIKDVFDKSDIVYLEKTASETYRLAQIPEVEGAIITLKPQTGEILAISGGFDFYASKYNRAIQAQRQPGSNFKPFIYSSALANNYTTASIINDAPVVIRDKQLEDSWRPSNYSGKFFGPTSLRKALYKSRNMVSIRLLMDIGINKALEHIKKFGIDTTQLPKNLSLSLGSANMTPLEIASAYAVLANGGYPVKPWFIKNIVDSENNIVYEHQPQIACSPYYEDSTCPEDVQYHINPGVDESNIFLTTSMLKDVIKLGTGRKALTLNRKDIAGKTGTTNDQYDAWFSGYTPDITTTCWVGFDQPKSLGKYETGGRAALPMWIDFMKKALEYYPENIIPQPEDIISVKIDKESGLLATPKSKNTLFEYFIKGTEPVASSENNPGGNVTPILEELNEELF